jgi:hypothetical protein
MAIFEATVEYTFLKLLEVAQGKSGYLPVCESVAICTLSQDIKCTIKVQVPLDFNVCECCDLNGKFIRLSFPGEKAASPAFLL